MFQEKGEDNNETTIPEITWIELPFAFIFDTSIHIFQTVYNNLPCIYKNKIE